MRFLVLRVRHGYLRDLLEGVISLPSRDREVFLVKSSEDTSR